MTPTRPGRPHPLDDVAIIGMGCRLPAGVTTPGRLWEVLTAHPSALTENTPLIGEASATAAPAGLEGLVLVAVDDALADAQIAPDTLSNQRVGVYLGASGGRGSAAAGRSVCAHLRVRGRRALRVQGSSAMAAVHHAANDVRSGERAIAIVVGAHHPSAAGPTADDAALALILVPLVAARAAQQDSYALLAGTAVEHRSARPSNPRTRQAAVIGQAMTRAGRTPDQVAHLHTATGHSPTDRELATSVRPAPVHPLPTELDAGAAGALVAVMASALTLHHTFLTADPGDLPVGGVHAIACDGTHGHAVLAAAPTTTRTDRRPRLPDVVVLSAPTLAGLEQAARDLAERVPALGSVQAAAVASRHSDGRHTVRCAVAAADMGALMQALRSIQDGEPNPDVIGPHLMSATPTQLVFVYTGTATAQGRPLPDELMRLTAYKTAFQAARRALEEHAPRVWDHDQPVTSEREAAQATFASQIALTDLLAAHGVHPHTTIGDGLGRAASAYARGTLTLDQAARHALDPARVAGAERGWPIAQAASVSAPTAFVVIGPYGGLGRTLADAAGPHHHISVLTCDPVDLAHALGELYTLGHYPTGPAPRPVSSAEPAMTVSVPQVPPARHDWVSAHLLAAVRRVAHIDPGTPATVTWNELQLSDRQTIHLLAQLRQVPAWSHLRTSDLHPHQSLSACATTLTGLLSAPVTLEVS